MRSQSSVVGYPWASGTLTGLASSTILQRPLGGVAGELGSILQFELLFDAALVSLNGLNADVQFPRDLLQREAVADHPENF
jgi:hypothetical protein